MRKHLLSLLCALCVLAAVPSAAGAEARRIGQVPLVVDTGVHDCFLPDGDDFVLVGREKQMDSDVGKAMAVGLNEVGEEQWRVTVEDQQEFTDIVRLADDTLVGLTGRWSADFDVCNYELVWMKNAQITRTMEIPVTVNAVLPRLFPASDGFFTFVGEYKQADKHGGIFYAHAIERRDDQGNLRWRHVFDKNEVNCKAMLEVDDGFIFVGEDEEQQTGERGGMGVMTKFSFDGRLLWLTNTPGKELKEYVSIAQSAEGNLLAAGKHTIGVDWDYIEMVPTLACFLPDGTLLWEKEYPTRGKNAEFFGVVPWQGTYWVLCNEADELGNVTTSLMKVGEDGQLLDVQELPSDGDDTFILGKFYQVDGKTRIAGQTQIGANGLSDPKIYLYEMQ